MKGLKFNTVDPRRQALMRAGGAVAVAVVLLLVALWFEARPATSDPESVVTEVVTLPAPAPEPVAAQPEAGVEAPVAETPPPEVVEAPPKPPLADGYMVQLGVFGAMDNAETLRKNVAARNLPVRIESRVVVGPFSDKAEAEAMREQLRRESVAEGIVVPPRNVPAAVSHAALPAVKGTSAKATAAKPAKAQKKRQENGPVRGRAG